MNRKCQKCSKHNCEINKFKFPLCSKCYPIKKDKSKVKHGYWTGRTFVDDAHSEGFASWMTEEEKRIRREADAHTTHCSVCGAMFDDRYIDGWKGCPYCFSILDLERPNNAYFLAWETKRASMEESAKRCGYDINWEEKSNE